MPKASEKPYGIWSALNEPGLKDIDEDIDFGGGLVASIHDGIFEVGYENESEVENAKEIANNLISSWVLNNGVKITPDFNMSWCRCSDSGRAVGLSLKENIIVRDRPITTTIIALPMRYVVRVADSYSFKTYFDMAKKADKDKSLSIALSYFSDEVIDSKKPKVGVYRIVEELSKKVGGSKKLAELVGKNEKYIKEINQSCQEHRHSLLWIISKHVQSSLTDQECIDRVRFLIQTYAASIK
jgi:hypothetical protein